MFNLIAIERPAALPKRAERVQEEQPRMQRTAPHRRNDPEELQAPTLQPQHGIHRLQEGI